MPTDHPGAPRPAPLRVLAALALAIIAPCAPAAAPRFSVAFDASLRAEPVSGRLVVYLIAPDSGISNRSQPADAPFFEKPQPCFGVTVTDLAPGTPVTIDDAATAFPAPPSRLPKGKYRVQAVLDQARENSEWKREAGNLYSATASVELDPSHTEPVEIKLTKVTKPAPPAPVQGAEIFEARSELLSKFHNRPVDLRAGVVYPIDWQPNRSYAAVYEIPGYGGDARTALFMARGRTPERAAALPQAEHELWSNAFRIVLDPESGTGGGHTLFADSDNNGPCAQALVEELIPALEAKFNLIARSEARLITGHSSGGWSSLWLQLTHPETFAGAWPSSPDPVDFRRFQRTDIYANANMYLEGLPGERAPVEGTTPGTAPGSAPGSAPSATPSYRSLRGEVLMTVRTENAVEEVIGPANTSAQQWDSWQAVFGPRDPATGTPAALYNPITGEIDHEVAERFKRYDIGELLRTDPAKYAPILRQRVRLIVGATDSYYLNEAVTLLKNDLDRLSPPKDTDTGYIKVLPGDHSTVMMNPEARAAHAEMLECLRASGVLGR